MSAERRKQMSHYETGLKEECGVFGIYDLDGGDVSRSVYYGLEALQHRGQESCGIAVSDTEGPKGRVKSCKGIGLLSEVFRPGKIEELNGNIGVGHVRYSTSGSLNVNNAQPLVLNYIKGSLALAHNGNLVNALELREEMENSGAIFHTTIDSEVIAYCIARERVKSDKIEDAVKKACDQIRGAFAIVLMSPRKLIGARDPYGLRPLCIGKRDNAYIFASEDCALHSIGAEFIRDVRPGEIVTVGTDGELRSSFMDSVVDPAKQARCIFEYIYFARLDSKIDGVSVYDARIRGGAALARSFPVEADLVVGVPDSGLASAKGYSEESGIPFGMAFHKNSYVGRTFIKPSQDERESSVRIKLSVIESVVKGQANRSCGRFHRQGNHNRKSDPHPQAFRRDGSTCANQFAAVPASLLFRRGCSVQQAADRVQSFGGGDPQNDRSRLAWIYADRGITEYGGEGSSDL